jgi:hypothetical protein
MAAPRTTLCVGAILATWGLVSGIGKAEEKARPSEPRRLLAVVYLINWGATDLRVGSLEALSTRRDVELRIYEELVASRLKQELRTDLTCQKAEALPLEELRIGIRFYGDDGATEDYLASPQRITSVKDHCSKIPDDDFAHTLSALFLWADPLRPH